MSNEHDTNDDLPRGLADMLRSVPPADPVLRDSQIERALSELERTGAEVVRVDFRRRLLGAVAAAAVLVVAGAGGWAVRGMQNDNVVAAVPAVDSTAPLESPDTTVPPKAAAKNGDCTITIVDSTYIGEYVNPSDGRTYAVYVFGGRLEFFDKVSCTQVELAGVSRSAISTTTVP